MFDPQSIATFNVSENATVSSVVHVVNATDRDSGLAGTVKYGIVDPTGTFNISQSTGESTSFCGNPIFEKMIRI